LTFSPIRKRLWEQAVSLLVKDLGDLLTVRELDRPLLQNSDESIRAGISLFNMERYWESHESFESAWLSTSGRDREVLQAIILLAAALVHLQKDEIEVALSIMRRADEKLPDHGILFQIDLAKLKGVLVQVLAQRRPVFFKLPIG
jgi:hypothetical protein